jgi:hypothetical protein
MRIATARLMGDIAAIALAHCAELDPDDRVARQITALRARAACTCPWRFCVDEKSDCSYIGFVVLHLPRTGDACQISIARHSDGCSVLSLGVTTLCRFKHPFVGFAAVAKATSKLIDVASFLKFSTCESPGLRA